mgnify:CR=1 FL=1
MNEDGGKLILADNATTLSHLAIDQSVSNGEKYLDIVNNADSTCIGDNSTTEGDSRIVVEKMVQKGDLNLALSRLTELNIASSFSVPSQKALTVSKVN